MNGLIWNIVSHTFDHEMHYNLNINQKKREDIIYYYDHFFDIPSYLMGIYFPCIFLSWWFICTTQLRLSRTLISKQWGCLLSFHSLNELDEITYMVCFSEFWKFLHHYLARKVSMLFQISWCRFYVQYLTEY